jgi:3-oxoacyl-[acyl-carrier protein] reductase
MQSGRPRTAQRVEMPQWRYVCGNAANIALNGLTKSLGGMSVDDGIRVVGVNPGAVETERWRRIHMARAEKLLGDPNRYRELLSGNRPHGRAVMPDEIANVTVFLASDRASWVSGAVLSLDCGAIYRANAF